MTNGVPEHPHSVLGIARGASREEIKAAYHRKIKFWHPDLNKTPFAADRFKEVQAAAKALLEQADGKFDHVARQARQWSPSAQHMRANTYNQARARAGVPMTLAACGAGICCGLVLFAFRWRQHDTMYPRRPRSLPGPRPQVDPE